MEIYKKDSGELKMNFNDICLRELGLDITEDTSYVFDTDDIENGVANVYQINDKYLKYCDDNPYPFLGHDEIDFNMIENFRLMENLFSLFILKYAKRKGIEIVGYTQSIVKGSKKGKFILNYKINGQILSIESDAFENESVRVLNLVCKLNHRDHMYPFEDFDVIVLKDKEV